MNKHTLERRNFAVSRLAGGVSSSSTTLTITSGDQLKFPTSPPFRCVVWSQAYAHPSQDPNAEIVEVTGISGNTFTIQRGLEGTVPNEHLEGDFIGNVITAGTLDKIDETIFNSSGIDASLFGSDKNLQTLTNAINAITNGSLGDVKTLVISPGTWTISDDLTIPSSVGVVVQNGAVLDVADGKTLTINGPFSAGLYQVFSGNGSVLFGQGAVTEVYPEWWGAKGDSSTDCTTALQKAIRCAGLVRGGLVKLSKGTYVVSDKINIESPVHIEGIGNDDLAQFGLSSEYSSTILATHSNSCVFYLYTQYIMSGCHFRNFNVKSYSLQNGCSGFHFHINNNFVRNFYFENVSMFYLDCAVKVSKVSGSSMYEVGLLSFISCIARSCNYFVRCIGTQINILNMINCDIIYIQNMILDAVVLGGHIVGNCFEYSGSLKLGEGSNSVVVKSNYFEGNAEPILTQACRNYELSNNFYLSSGLPKIYGSRLYISDPCIVDTCIMDSSIRRVLDITNSYYQSEKYVVCISNVDVKDRKHVNVPVYNSYYGVSTPTGLIPYMFTRYPAYRLSNIQTYQDAVYASLGANEYLVMNFMLRKVSGNTNYAYCAVRNDSTGETWTGSFYEIRFSTDQTYNVSIVYKSPVQQSAIFIFYFVVSVGNNVTIDVTRSLFYSTSDAGSISHVNPELYRYSSSAPSGGEWVVGDVVYDYNPSPGGYIGWVCTSSGVPGTWKGFGAIAT